MREERHLYPDAALFLYIILLSLPLVRYHQTPLVGYLYRNSLLVIMILVIISSCQLMALDCGRRPYLI